MENTNKKLQVNGKLFREMIMDMDERASEISNGLIHIVEKNGKVAIDWCSIGAQSTEVASEFGAAVLKICGIVDNMNHLVEKVASKEVQ